jgi:hypothetical protein
MGSAAWLQQPVGSLDDSLSAGCIFEKKSVRSLNGPSPGKPNEESKAKQEKTVFQCLHRPCCSTHTIRCNRIIFTNETEDER